MSIVRYRITDPTLAMFEEDGRHLARFVPTGAIITVDGAFDGNRLMDVVWDEKKVMMFTEDLRTRAVAETSNLVSTVLSVEGE